MRRNKSGKRTVRVAAYLLAAVLAVSTFAGCGGIESGGEAEGTADSGNEKEAGEQNNAMAAMWRRMWSLAAAVLPIGTVGCSGRRTAVFFWRTTADLCCARRTTAQAGSGRIWHGLHG